MSGRNSTWAGNGFEFRDGRTCAGFRVTARSREEAARLVNRTAGWRWFKVEDDLGEGRPSDDAEESVWICWAEDRWEKLSAPARARGRLPDAEPTGPTKRVQLSMQRLREAGGHRSTVRFRGQAWEDLQLLMAETGRKQCDVLEELIRKGAAELRSRKK